MNRRWGVCLPAAFLIIACASNVHAEGSISPLERLNTANESYRQGDFAGAESTYRSLLEEGVESGSLYYNLGNACFKQKKLGEAIYYWEKAGRLLPRDPDIRDNLELANLLVVDRIEVPPDPLPVRLIDGAVHWLTIGQESWILLSLFVSANILMTVSILTTNRRASFWSRTTSLSLLAFLLPVGASLGWKIYESQYRLEGIVIEERAEIRSGPGPENVTIVTVHEGIKVRVRGEAAGWVQVSLPNGWTGWVERDTIRVL